MASRLALAIAWVSPLGVGVLEGALGSQSSLALLVGQGLVLALAAVAAASLVATTLRLGIGPTPSSRRAARAVVEALPADLVGEVHELGAGFGALAFRLADRLPGARVVAWELSILPWLVCSLRQRLRRRPNLELRRADFLAADLRSASAVVCFLFTGAMRRLSPKLREELPAGALVVSHTFTLPGWSPEAVQTVADLHRTPVYRYRQGTGPEPGPAAR